MWIIRSMASTDVEERLSFFLHIYLPLFPALLSWRFYSPIYLSIVITRSHPSLTHSLSPLLDPPYYLHLNTAYLLTFSPSLLPSHLPCRCTLLLHVNRLVREYRPLLLCVSSLSIPFPPPPLLSPTFTPPFFYEYTPHAVSADYWIQLYNYILSSTPSFSSSSPPSLCPCLYLLSMYKV